MAVKIFASFLLVAIFTNSIHHLFGLEDIPTVPSDSSFHRHVCENVQPEEIQEVIHQLNLVDQFEYASPYQLVLLLSDDIKNTVDLFQHLEPKTDVNLQNILYREPTEEFLTRAKESIFQFQESSILYYVVPGMNALKNEIFAKYITYKIVDKAENIRIVLVDVVPDSVENQTDTNLQDKPSSGRLDRLQNLIENTEMIFTNVSQYNGSIGLIQIPEGFTDFRYFVNRLDADNAKNCNRCVRLNVFPKSDENGTKIFSCESSGDNFRDKFFNFVDEINSKYYEEKNLNYTFSSNEQLTRVLDCVESVLHENLTSDLDTLTQTIHDYFLSLENNSTDVRDLLRQLHRDDFSPAFKLGTITDGRILSTLITSTDIYSEKWEIENENEIFSRIVPRMEQVRFLQSGRSDKMNVRQLLKQVSDVFENNISKTTSFYEELNELYLLAESYSGNDSKSFIQRKFEDLWQKIDSEPDNVNAKVQALIVFKMRMLKPEME